MNVKTDHKGSIPEELFDRLSEYLTAQMGLHFKKKSGNELYQKMSFAMKEFGYDNVEEFIAWLVSQSLSQKEIEILAAHLTVGETYFFREKKSFEILEQSILPTLIEARRKSEKRLRIWSAGCSSGEEPYSIAIVLDRLLPDHYDWNVTILATDINTKALKTAIEGIYSDWSFRNTSAWLKDKYFEKVNANHYVLQPGIRKMVAFSYLNLSEDLYPSIHNNTNAMDVILCRNVLMYFAPEAVNLTAGRFYRSLVEGGWLITSPVETSQLMHSPFAAARFDNTTFYKKGFL